MIINKLRFDFLNYFYSKNHTIAPGGNLILDKFDDLLFANSGMVQFKDIFLGKSNINNSRVTTVQLCMRVGGKHNDLENIGFTKRHHTLFEMLGNFSFGDYFKKDAISYAWDFLVNILNIPSYKLCVSVFKNDIETATVWRKHIKLNSNQLIFKGIGDNFWSMGNIGLCGPCTEIYYDRGTDLPFNERFIELWNIVFLEFNKLSNYQLIKLNKSYVDTGLGLERVASVLCNVFDNYELSIFKDIIIFLNKISGCISSLNSKRVISDHIRACVFLISFGLYPGNSGCSYVLRRILRRAIYHGTKIGIKKCFLYKLVPIVVFNMYKFYPNLIDKINFIQNVIKEEEEKFILTLSRGLHFLNKFLVRNTYDILYGKVLFKLYETYGLPLYFIFDVLRDHNIILNTDNFKFFFKKN